ncbi:MAG TPA: hypothetical protein VK528_09415 [Flavobacterium sp.]|nr:hypothetical protein [Flavobacterium sp.]
MKISKCTSLFLALLILVSNVGLAFNVHYCGGEISGISAAYGVENLSDVKSLPKQKSCCAAKAEEGKSCCKDKVIKVKEKSDITFKVFSFQIDAPFVIANWKPVVFIPTVKITNEQTASYYCDAHAPPLYELFSQRLFYA